MAAIRSKDSKAELAVRKRLHARGLRYRVHYPIIGKPDIVFTRQKLAVFVDGDFWHGNAWKLRGFSSLSDFFPNRTDWWVAKITRNMERDAEVNRALNHQGWRVFRCWESEVQADPEAVVERIVLALRDDEQGS